MASIYQTLNQSNISFSFMYKEQFLDWWLQKYKKARYFQISLRSHLWMNFKNSSHSTCITSYYEAMSGFTKPLRLKAES